MSQACLIHQLKKTVLAVGFLLIVSFLTPKKILAQTASPTPTLSPESGSTQVSATMPDIVDPSTPILVSPVNNSLVTTSTPTFIWNESTDNVAVSGYSLYLDGSLNISDVLTTGSYTDYTLSYDATTGRYSLTIINSLSQGDHTWKIRASDAAGNFSDSATWSFEVDSIAPTFVISDIGDEEVSISAQDADTVPDDAIELDENEPEIIATGEANSEVVMTIEIDGEDDDTVTQDIDSDGDWSYTLDILPRDTEITLSFIITDLAGHISAIENIKIIIVSQEIVIPPQPSATITSYPYAPSATPITTVYPTATRAPGEPTYTPTPPPTASPTPEPTAKPIKIPYKPPKEIIRDLTPPVILEVKKIPLIKKLINSLGPILTLLALLAPITGASLIFIAESGRRISWEMLTKFWHALGLWPTTEYQGWVFDRQTQKGIPFAQISFISQTPESLSQAKLNLGIAPPEIPFVETTISDQRGLYPVTDLPPGSYRVSVQHPDFSFPTRQAKPEATPIIDYYQGELLNLETNDSDLSLIIPMDSSLNSVNAQQKLKLSFSTKIKIFAAKFINQEKKLFAFFSLSSLLVCFYYPSFWNIISLGSYLGLWSWRKISAKTTRQISGLITNEHNQPLPDTLIRAEDTHLETIRVELSDDKGHFSLKTAPGLFHVSAHKLFFHQFKHASRQTTDHPIHNSLNTQTRATVDTQKDNARIVIMMNKL